MSPKTPHRTVRIEDDLWHAAQEKAAAEGRTVTEIVREALALYVTPTRKPSK
jgi:predicted transcriptional regulator